MAPVGLVPANRVAKTPRRAKSSKASPEGAAPTAPRPQSRAASSPFDPATGEWISVPAPAAAPDAAKKGGATTFWNIVLIIDLALLGVFGLFGAWVGGVLIAAPDSELAQRYRDGFVLDSARDVLVNSFVPFVMFGIIPLLWLLGTRVQPVEGTKRFLQLHNPARAILRGVGLAVICLLGVVALASAYELALNGLDGLKDPSSGEDNPAVASILEHLNWPLAVAVALFSGVGEEIFFRGLLQRKLGLWPQALLFGFSHLAGGYLPQVAAGLGIGILFGFVMKRGGSLYTIITAHVLYNFTLLAVALVFPEYA